MINRPQVLTAAATIILLIFGGSAAASDNATLTYASGIKTCIAEVADHANYEGAIRVLHIVVSEKRTRLRYMFPIDTFVYTESDDTAARKYASHCVARGGDRLVKFRIDEVSA